MGGWVGGWVGRWVGKGFRARQHLRSLAPVMNDE